MKRMLALFIVLVFAVAVAGPALGPAKAVMSAVPEAVDNDQETPPPPQKGTSPADPSIQPPNVGDWCCSRCCSCGPRGKRYGKKGLHGPMLAQPGMKGEPGERCLGGCCGHGKGHRFNRGHGVGKGCGVGRGHGFGKRHGHGIGNAAERMLRHAPELGLTEDQIAKLETLSHDTKKQLIDLRADIEKEQLEVHKKIRSGSDDLTQIKRHLSAIAKARADIQAAKIASLFEARKLLTDDQKKLIKEKHPRMGMILD
ncbi:MAG: Spy/CpxP family protein refolding chaperone [Candidatus Latescibacterota bacterium]|nr:MAG: Spy/CpxP family protein refolding chaperone [Candidatus Latescibacterota bacterium]